MKLRQGQYVRHSKYGWGKVLDLEGNQTMVYFASVGIKRFAGSSEVFDLVEGEAAKRKTPA